MIRPCFLVVDREFSSMISTRKLVIETAKFNVITAYSGVEALAVLKKFPAIDAIVVDAHMRDIPCEQLVAGFKALQPGIPVVSVHTPGASPCFAADHHVESMAPEQLLATLRRLHPEAADAVHRRNQELRSDDK
jgi:DNA-binding NtrC family response regulator